MSVPADCSIGTKLATVSVIRSGSNLPNTPDAGSFVTNLPSTCVFTEKSATPGE